MGSCVQRAELDEALLDKGTVEVGFAASRLNITSTINQILLIGRSKA